MLGSYPNLVINQLGVIGYWILVSGVTPAAGQKTASLIEKKIKRNIILYEVSVFNSLAPQS
jgi:hypothetical protein